MSEWINSSIYSTVIYFYFNSNFKMKACSLIEQQPKMEPKTILQCPELLAWFPHDPFIS